ncbi:unnamed protein product [Rotaria magnacalcarata]
MENKKSNKRNSALDNFVISSKKLRDENINLNFISNPSSSSSTSTTMNALTCSSPSDNSSTCFIGTDAANLTLNTEYSSPKSSLTTYPTDVSRTSEDPPSQPRLAIYPIDKDNRSFQERWYSNHPWMEYSIKLDSVFCYFCRHFSQGSTPTRIQRDAFTTSGFNTWKRALARNRGFDRHVICQTHIISSANFLQYQSRGMKLIKNYARNSMGDERLSDLSVLAIERELGIDFEKVIDVFAIQHKNSRIC